jgi:hypothetical protein
LANFEKIHLHKIKGVDLHDNIAQQIEEAEAKAPEDLTEEDKMALLGRPKNGDIVRAQLRVKESKEFKVSTKKICNIISYFSTEAKRKRSKINDQLNFT